MKKIRNINIIFLLLIYIIDISSCIEEAPIEYDNLEYLETKTYILNKTEKNEMIFYLKIKVDTILSKNYCYINLGQTNPQVLSLEYKFGKNSNDSSFTYLKNWITINDGSQHIYYYEMEKPEEKGYNLYLKITVKNYYDKQKLTVESTDSQFNFYLLIGLIIASSAIIVIIVVILSFYCIYKSKVDTNNPSSYDVIFVPVGPSDF